MKKEEYFSPIVFQVKNEQNSCLKNNQVIIGEARINNNILFNNKDNLSINEGVEVCFNGFIKLLFRGCNVIGRLKLKISYSQPALGVNEDIVKKGNNSLLLDVSQDLSVSTSISK